jgi:predicted nucleic acid-binding protein
MEDLAGGPVGLDTALFIYLIEEDPTFLPLVEPIFAAIDAGRLEGVTSDVALLEVLVAPYRHQSDPLAERYEALLTRSRNLQVVSLDRPQLRAAARLRAATGVRTPDALQLAAALTEDCTVFLTNDRRLPPRLGGMTILQLADYLTGAPAG